MKAYEANVLEGTINYKPSIGAATQTGQTEPITIDIDIRYVSLFHGQDEADDKR